MIICNNNGGKVKINNKTWALSVWYRARALWESMFSQLAKVIQKISEKNKTMKSYRHLVDRITWVLYPHMQKPNNNKNATFWCVKVIVMVWLEQINIKFLFIIYKNRTKISSLLKFKSRPKMIITKPNVAKQKQHATNKFQYFHPQKVEDNIPIIIIIFLKPVTFVFICLLCVLLVQLHFI